MLGNLVIAPLMGKELHNTETFGKADPYVVVTLGAHAGKTEIHKNAGSNPRWNSRFTFPLMSMTDVVEFEIFDKEKLRKDVLMGRGSFAVCNLAQNPKWIGDVQIFRNSKPAGSLQVEFDFQRSQ